MKIYCEIPDDVGQIFKEFLLISREGDQSVGQHMALRVANEAKRKLHDQWNRLSWEMHVGRDDSKEIAQKEIENRLGILEKFCRGQEGL